MQNKQLPEILEKLKKVSLTGKTAYAVARNIHILESEMLNFQEMIKPTEAYLAFEDERIKLATKHAKKDEKGKPITKINTETKKQEFDLENQEEFEKEFEELKEKNKSTIEFRTKQMTEFNKFAEEKSKVEFYQIKEDEIPETATVDDYYVLGFFIE
jgi:hypothetical protein